jgi:hypothetical protein
MRNNLFEQEQEVSDNEGLASAGGVTNEPEEDGVPVHSEIVDEMSTKDVILTSTEDSTAVVPKRKPRMTKDMQALDGISLPHLFKIPGEPADIEVPRPTRAGRTTQKPSWMVDYTT